MGLSTLDVIQRVPHLPARNAKVTAMRQDIAAGGPALNAAVIFAALGGHATLVTRIGHSSVAALIRADLETQGVDIVDLATPGYRPAVSTITVDDTNGDRQIVSTDALGGTRQAEKQANIDETIQSAFVNAMPVDIVHIDGHHPDLAMAAARLGARRHMPCVLDAGRWKDVMADLIPLATEVICSGDFRAPEHEKDLLEWILGQGAVLAAVTHGAEPTEWQTADSGGNVAAVGVNVIDTLGAGDFFHGAYSFARVSRDAGGRSATPRARIRFASHVAALKCTKPGTRGWLTDLGDVSPFDSMMERA